MTRTPRLPGPRPGFTLVELLVAMALIVLVMAILSAAFQVGMDSLSELKSIGTLSSQLRTAQMTLQGDLRANHLEDATGSPVRISDPRMHPYIVSGQPVPNPAWTNPNRGYLSVTQRAMGTLEGGGPDPDGITSYRGDSENQQTPGYHILRMTVQRSGQSAQDTFSAAAPINLPVRAGSLGAFDPSGTQLVSRWAEVVYFIRPNGLYTADDPPGSSLPVFTLHRRQRVLGAQSVRTFESSPPPGEIQAKPEDYPDLSWRREGLTSPQQNFLNTPAEITTPAFRLGGARALTPTYEPGDPTRPAEMNPPPTADNPWGGPTSPPAWPTPLTLPFPYRIPQVASGPAVNRHGSDVLLNNVVSFHVQVVTDPPLPIANGQYTFGPGAFQPRPWTYDTALPQTAPYDPFDPTKQKFVGVRAVKVTLRVYDSRNNQTRQVTIVQDL